MVTCVPLDNQELLKSFEVNRKKLVNLQRKYKSLILGTKIRTADRKKNLVFARNLQKFKSEKREIEIELLLAGGKTQTRANDRHIRHLAEYVGCYQYLESDIKELNVNIFNLKDQISRAEKLINELNSKATSEQSYNDHVKKSQRTLERLETQLDVSRKRECKLITQNKHLRDIILNMLFEKALFNKLWRRMIQQLQHDQKFLIDLVERAITTFDQGIDIYQKMEAMPQKNKRDTGLKLRQMKDLMKSLTSDQIKMKFYAVKGQKRELADLEQREYARRSAFKKYHSEKIETYNNILNKILKFSDAENISQAIEKFKKQENIYYSNFNYMNELSYQMKRLHDHLHQLYCDVDYYKEINSQEDQKQDDLIINLQKELVNEEMLTQEKLSEKHANDDKLENLFNGIFEIFNMINCDSAPLMLLLGDYSKITIFNIEKFLKILEARLNDVIAFVYYIQRKDGKMRQDKMVVHSVSRTKEEPTDIDDIVLAQQCAECAEGEDVDLFDEDLVMPLTEEEIKARIREKVFSAEIQYRLHSLSQCRLPRSRMMANRRNQG